jgi:hypothetical protein
MNNKFNIGDKVKIKGHGNKIFKILKCYLCKNMYYYLVNIENEDFILRDRHFKKIEESDIIEETVYKYKDIKYSTIEEALSTKSECELLNFIDKCFYRNEEQIINKIKKEKEKLIELLENL